MMASAAFRSVISRHPLVSNMVLYAGLYSSADLTRQAITGQEDRDIGSAVRTACVGSLGTSPFNYAWFQLLDKVIKGRSPGIICAKVACDQLIAGPIGLAIFFIGTSILERKENIFEDLRSKGLKTYMIGCVYWPAMQAFNFAVLPTSLRTAYVGTAAFVWCCILSFNKSQPTPTVADPPTIIPAVLPAQ